MREGLSTDIIVIKEHGFSAENIGATKLAHPFCQGGGGYIYIRYDILRITPYGVKQAAEKVFEATDIKLYTNHSKLFLIGIYESPSVNVDSFFQNWNHY